MDDIEIRLACLDKAMHLALGRPETEVVATAAQFYEFVNGGARPKRKPNLPNNLDDEIPF